MGEMNQESDFEVPNQEEDDLQLQESINLSLLHLDSFKNNHQNRHPCTTCACNVTVFNLMKCLSPKQIWEPKSKKPSLDNLKGEQFFIKIELIEVNWLIWFD